MGRHKIRKALISTIYIAVLFIFLSLVAVAIWCCMGRPIHATKVQLQGGYYLAEDYGNAMELCDSHNEVIVGPPVDGYKVYDNIIVGHVAQGKTSKVCDATPGYFVLNTRNNKIKQGLSEKEWLFDLGKYGIKQRPRLHYPRRWF